MEKDFKFIISLMDGFVKQASIQQTLNTIEMYNITGWEIWFQVEFASYLSKNIEVAEWYREEQFNIDKRKNNHRNKMAIDFLVRKKRFSRDTFIALELKQHSSIETCITNMLKDVKKILDMKSSENYCRSYWSIGIHPKESKKVIKNKISKKEEQCGIYLSEYIEIRFIPNTNFAYTIF
ncbi:MAG: hypothetical protein GXO60_08035 [Epsilonproteobacteria bacterium]|nr:hypothetical protein [Campylobacterota bacterium]